MDMLEQLQEFVGDNPQALEVLGKAQESITANVAKMQEYEAEMAKIKGTNSDIVSNRDKLKATIKETLGIEEVSKDAIMAKLATMGDTEIKNQYENQLHEVKKEFGTKIDTAQNTIAEYEGQIKELKMKNAISTTDIMGQVNGSKAGEMLQALLAEGAEFDAEGNVRYLGGAGETLLNSNGDPMTLDDKIAALKQSKDYDFLFQTRFLNGGGAPTAAPTMAGSPAGNPLTGGKLTRTTMTMEDKIAYADKYGQAAYDKLPLV